MAYSDHSYESSPLKQAFRYALQEIGKLINQYLNNAPAMDYLRTLQDFYQFLDSEFFPRFSNGKPSTFMEKGGLVTGVASLGIKVLRFDSASKDLKENPNLEKLHYEIAKLRYNMIDRLSDQQKEKFSCFAPFFDPEKIPELVRKRAGPVFSDKEAGNFQALIADQLQHQNVIIQAYEKKNPLQPTPAVTPSTDDSDAVTPTTEDSDEESDLDEHDDESNVESSQDGEETVVPPQLEELPDSLARIEKLEEKIDFTTIPSVLALEKVRENETRLKMEIKQLEENIDKNKEQNKELRNIIDSTQKNIERMANCLSNAPGTDAEWLEFFKQIEDAIPDQSNEKKPHIPFRGLDGLELLKPKTLGLKPGFDLLLTLLGTQDDIRQQWSIYRARQEDRFKEAHTTKEYIDQRALLISAIETQKKAIELKIAKEEEKSSLAERHSEMIISLGQKVDTLEEVKQSIPFLEFYVLEETERLQFEVDDRNERLVYPELKAVDHKRVSGVVRDRERQEVDALEKKLKESEKARERILLADRKKLEQTFLAEKKIREEANPELTLVVHLQNKHENEYQSLDKTVKEALSNYTNAKDAEPVLLAIMDAKKVVPEGSDIEKFLDNIYWKVQYCSAGKAYPKQPDNDPILTIKNQLSSTSPKYMTALNQIDQRLTQMYRHGLKLYRQKGACADDVMLLERKLRLVLERFILQHGGEDNTVSPEAFQAFKKTFSEKLRALYNEPSMSHHRAKWKQWVANVALAFTSFVSYVIRTRYTEGKVGRATEGHDTFFFHRTERQNQIDSVEDALNKLDEKKKIL